MSASAMAGAYDTAAGAWLAGPENAYRRFAEALVAAAPVPLKGLRVLDIGAGAGAVSLALLNAGASVVAVDGSPGMLRAARAAVPDLEVVLADCTEVPFADGSFDGVTSGFCLNHLPEPHLLLTEAARVTRAGGFILASTFTANDDHPAKPAIESVARDWGWEQPDWHREMQHWTTLTDTPAGMTAAAERAGLARVSVREVDVDTGLNTAASLVAWRLGMPHFAGFVEGLEKDYRRRFVNAAEAAVGPNPQPLRRAVLILSSHSPV